MHRLIVSYRNETHERINKLRIRSLVNPMFFFFLITMMMSTNQELQTCYIKNRYSTDITCSTKKERTINKSRKCNSGQTWTRKNAFRRANTRPTRRGERKTRLPEIAIRTANSNDNNKYLQRVELELHGLGVPELLPEAG